MSRFIFRFGLSAVCAVLAILFVPASTHAQLLGFSDESSAMQRDLEADYDSQLNADNLDEWLQYLTRHPTHVGSPGGKANAEWIADKFRSWGFETRIDTYHVMFPTPRERMVELVSPNRYVLKLEEPEVEGDRTSGITQDLLPTYNAYSADGDVEGEVVYVNYGIPADYDELARHGISVEGKIALARYGGSWRGIKPKVAAQHGAIATLIYSDPRDDGYFQGDVYPDGPYRMAQSAQRGSVEDMPQYPGDPLTPGVGATLDAER